MIEKTFDYNIIEVCNMWIFVTIKNVQPEVIVGALYFNPSYNMHICVEELENTLDRVENEYPGSQLVLIGDFNARTGSNQKEDEEILFENTNAVMLRVRL
ncbi:hypothetical protein M8J77_022194 [Diaphorina citri]|nr:hypothetical protein M8J77_022194 [Diaphorina citri]